MMHTTNYSIDKRFTITIDGVDVQVYVHVVDWSICHETGRLEFAVPDSKKRVITTHRYTIEEE